MNYKDLLLKYDVPAPRYTSYPTVPMWCDSPTTDEWIDSTNSAFGQGMPGWSLYLHIPYCETLCTFCGCNTSITRNHDREQPYIDMLHKEWSLYKERVPGLLKTPLRQLHLGGGTPTFLSAENLQRLVEPILNDCQLDPEHFEAALEVDPRRTTREQLEVLYQLGFRRVSLGVQDFNHEVQTLINRVQPFSMTKDLTDQARDLGYESINYDLIYGLPKQTAELMQKTAELTVQLRPDRIALYSLAKVPWIKPAQRLFKDEDLPEGPDKRALYELARSVLTEAGYVEIGMDHFALPTDKLYIAMQNRTLHRNFMGYADQRTDVLLGLGVSAISESPTCFHQNEKVLNVYERKISQGELPTLRGHKLSSEDLVQREQILKFMTHFEVELKDSKQIQQVSEDLSEMVADGLVQFEGQKMKLTDIGIPFLRNACLALDLRMRQKGLKPQTYSKAL